MVRLENFVCYIVLVFALCLVLFSCKDDDDNNSIVDSGIHPSVSINIDKPSVVFTEGFSNVPRLKIQSIIKNTGDCNLDHVSFKCEVKTKIGKIGEVSFFISNPLISPGEKLEKTVVSADSIPVEISYDEEKSEFIYDGYSKENINEILESVSLLEDSVLCV